MIFCVSCGLTDHARIERAGRSLGELRAAQQWPDLPKDCRVLTRAGIKRGDDFRVAARKSDFALSQQNERTLRCAAWYDAQAEAWATEGPR